MDYDRMSALEERIDEILKRLEKNEDVLSRAKEITAWLDGNWATVEEIADSNPMPKLVEGDLCLMDNGEFTVIGNRNHDKRLGLNFMEVWRRDEVAETIIALPDRKPRRIYLQIWRRK